MDLIDYGIVKMPNDPSLKVSISTVENADERASRLRIEEANAAHQRRKEMLLYSVTIGVKRWIGSWLEYSTNRY